MVMRYLFLLFFLVIFSCKKDNTNTPLDKKDNNENTVEVKQENLSLSDTTNIDRSKTKIPIHQESSAVVNDSLLKKQEAGYFTDEFVNLKDLSNDFVYDIKYATSDNFLRQPVYDCPECYLRKETALALIKANKAFNEIGYKILIYDCYRPLDVQKKMWAIMPGTHYVANPKKGSKHNRGAAVDLTLIDKNGKNVDMGTAFDFFGKEAHHTYTKLSKEALENRKLLRETLNAHNFSHILSEWWHYEYRPEMYKPASNFKWDCE
jgi:D-alanyl-D-alanine dipeptidase